MRRIICVCLLCAVAVASTSCGQQHTQEGSSENTISRVQPDITDPGDDQLSRSEKFQNWLTDTLQSLKNMPSADPGLGLVDRIIERPDSEVLVIRMSYRMPVTEIRSLPESSRLRVMLDYLVENQEVMRAGQSMALTEQYSYGPAYAASNPHREERQSVKHLELVSVDSSIVFDVVRGRLNSRTASSLR
jgi:hypothetical protein